MPNRILREGILTSERINRLGPAAELFYRRLMSVVDDFGRFDARPSLLRVSCYPLKVDSIREADISRSLAEVQSAGLIVLYEVDGKPYLEMQDFRQQMRAKSSKYPPPDGACVAHATHPPADAPHVRSETETETETKAKARVEVGRDAPKTPPLCKVWKEPTRDQVIEHGRRCNLTEAQTAIWYDETSSRYTADGHWVDRNNNPIGDWQRALSAWAGRFHENLRSSAKSRNGTPASGGRRAAPSKWDDEF